MVLRIGHRGAAGTHPENTLVSFRRAVELGAHGIEFDVHRTKDGHIVVIHDHHLERTTNGTGWIMHRTLDEIRQCDAGSWKGPEFSGERVPTLLEVIRQTPASLMLFLELKAGSLHYPGIEDDLVKLIREEGVLSRVQISSFDHHGLAKLHALEPKLELGMLFAENPLDPVGMAHACGANALHPSWQWTSPHMVEMAHGSGMKVNVWTVDDPQVIAIMKQFGVDGIISDYPDRV